MTDARRALGPWLALPAGAATWWVLGFLPWLAQGLRRAGPTGGRFAPDQGADEVRMAIPLLAEEVTGLVTMAVLGGATAVAVARGWRRRRPAAVAAAAGAATAAVIATLQSQHAVRTVTGDVASDPRVVHALALVACAATLVGVLLGLLAAIGPIWLVPAALAPAAALLPGWLEDLLPGTQAGSTRWMFAFALGMLLGACARRPRHLVAWVPAAGIAWAAQAVPPALLAAGTTIRPGSGLEDDPWRPATIGVEVFEAALTLPEAHWPAAWFIALVLALALTAVIAAITTTTTRRRCS